MQITAQKVQPFRRWYRRACMGLFDSKAKRVAQHRELLSLAKDALQRLHVEGYKTHEGVYEPVWKDFDAVPLEGQYWLRTYVDSLVTWVYDMDDGDLGKRDVIADLAESVTAARTVLAGIPCLSRHDLARARRVRSMLMRPRLRRGLLHVALDLGQRM